jgi:hypothetical protein
MKTPTRVGVLAQKNDVLRRLTEQASQLGRLNERLKTLLPPALAPHAEVAVVRDDTLVILASSAAWAARLRYSVPDLLRALAGDGAFPGIRNVRIRVASEISAGK